MSEIYLEVDGRKLAGWKRISVEREFGAICGRFSLGLLDSWEKISKSWFIKPFSKCRLVMDNDLIMTGYIDVVSIAKTVNGTEITAAGRDKTSDLVDCSAVLTAHEFENKNLSYLAKLLVKDFDITYREEESPGKNFKFIQITPGMRIASVLEEYAKYRGLFFVTDSAGQLVLTKPGANKSQVSLVVGENIKSFQVTYDTQQRFSKYHFEIQAQGRAEDFGTGPNQLSGEATDPGVPRHRPLSFFGGLNGDGEDLKKRAQWEADVRANKMTAVSLEVAGWRQGPNVKYPPWQINAITRVTIPDVGIDHDLLITSVRFSIDVNGGTVTTLGVESPDAYKAEPLRDPRLETFLNFVGDDA